MTAPPLTAAELDALAARYEGLEFTAAERHFLTDPLTGWNTDPLDRQRAYITRLALEPLQCPACHAATCRRAAATAWDLAGAVPDDAYKCPACGTPLTWHLDITGRSWFTTAAPLVARKASRDD